MDGTKTTWHYGSVERIKEGSNNPFFRRYIGGVAIVDYSSGGAQDVSYLIKDHLGSIHTVVNDSGSTTTMHFGAFGERQNTAWNGPLEPSGVVLHNMISTRGFTGHEQADGLGIIHMNGVI